jgi:hypothetical protein
MKKNDIAYVVLRSIALFLFYSAIVSLVKELFALRSTSHFTSWVVFLPTAVSLIEGIILWFIARPVSIAIFRNDTVQTSESTDLADIILFLSFIWFAFFRLIKIVSTAVFLLRDDLLLPGLTVAILKKQQMVHLSIDVTALIVCILVIRYSSQISRWFMYNVKPLDKR